MTLRKRFETFNNVMKKYIILIAAILFSGQSCNMGSNPVTPEEGYICFMSGKVLIINAGKEDKARVGDRVKKGMTIKTGNKSIVDIDFDVWGIRILENNTIEIGKLLSRITPEFGNKSVIIKTGKFYVSPTAIGGTRANIEQLKEKDKKNIDKIRGTESK